MAEDLDPAGSTEQEQTPTALALVQALAEMTDKYATAEGRAAAAEERVVHLEEQLGAQQAELDRLRAQLPPDGAVVPGESGPGPDPAGERQLGPVRAGPWWRVKGRRKGMSD